MTRRHSILISFHVARLRETSLNVLSKIRAKIKNNENVKQIAMATNTRLTRCTYSPVCVAVSSILSGLETRSLGLNTLLRHNVVSSLVTVCPSRSSVHRFLALTSSKQGVNVTCSRPQRNVHRPGLEPGNPLVRNGTPPEYSPVKPCKLQFLMQRASLVNNITAFLTAYMFMIHGTELRTYFKVFTE